MKRWKTSGWEVRIACGVFSLHRQNEPKPPESDSHMTDNSSENKRDRRGFLRAMLMDLPPKSEEEKREDKRLSQRASVLALKYGKSVAELSRIGVETPKRIDDTTYVVKISGHDSFGTRIHQELQVDIENDTVGKREPVQDAAE